MTPILLLQLAAAALPPVTPSSAPSPSQNAAPQKDEVTQALDDAREFAGNGEYAKALERYEWFHENALRLRPTMAGVRLSYALSEWVELGLKYPSARQSLEKRREEKNRVIEEGGQNSDLVADIVAINRYLGDKSRSLALFKELDQRRPEFAKQCFTYFKDQLLEAGEFDLYLKYTGDVKKYLARQIARNEELRNQLKGRGPRMEQTMQRFDERLVETTLTLSKLMADKGDAVLASELREMTAKAIPDPRLAPEK